MLPLVLGDSMARHSLQRMQGEATSQKWLTRRSSGEGRPSTGNRFQSQKQTFSRRFLNTEYIATSRTVQSVRRIRTVRFMKKVRATVGTARPPPQPSTIRPPLSRRITCAGVLGRSNCSLGVELLEKALILVIAAAGRYSSVAGFPNHVERHGRQPSRSRRLPHDHGQRRPRVGPGWFSTAFVRMAQPWRPKQPPAFDCVEPRRKFHRSLTGRRRRRCLARSPSPFERRRKHGDENRRR